MSADVTHSERWLLACPAKGHPRYVHARAGMLTVAAAVGADDFPPSQTVAARPTCGARVTADLHGSLCTGGGAVVGAELADLSVPDNWPRKRSLIPMEAW